MEQKPINVSPSMNATEASDGLDLAAIMQQNKNTKKSTSAENQATSQVTAPQNVSPLDALLEKNAKEGNGMVVSDNELETEEKTPQFKNPIETEERIQQFNDAISMQDKKLMKRKCLVQIKEATNPAEMAELETELDCLMFDDDGKPYFDYWDVDIVGEKHELTPKYFIIRTSEYGPYNPVTEQYYVKGLKPDFVMKKPDVVAALKKEDTPNTPSTGDNVDSAEDNSSQKESDESIDSKTDDEEVVDPHHQNLVQVIIDKTGYGNLPIELTEDDKKKIYESDELLITSVRKLDLKSIRVNDKDPDKPKRTFMETARAHQISNSHANVTFANSGFHAQMVGMSYGELTDVSLDPERITFDLAYKQLTVVYDKMVNLSRPKFTDIDDFLKNFAYADLDMALYGLYVATFPEIQQVGLECGRSECKTSFRHSYNTRTLLDFDRCSNKYLENFKSIIYSPASEYRNILDQSPLFNTLILEMPVTKTVFEFGPISAYDYLYKVMPLTDEQEFKRVFGDNPDTHTYDDLQSIPAIRRIFVPDNKGGYDDYDTLKDMIDVLGSLTPEETKIVRSVTRSVIADTTIQFGVRNIVCPKCGAKTEFVPIDIGNVVFQTYEQLRNTNVDVTKLLQI